MRTFFAGQDWTLYLSIGLLMLASLIMVASTDPSLFAQQLISVLLSILLIPLAARFNWRVLRSYPFIILLIYFLSLALLIFTSLFAPLIRNTRSWLVIGPVQFQVAEIMKVALIILLAYYFAKHHIGIDKLSNILRSFVYFAIPAFFVFLQPDMGTLLVLLGIWIGFLLVSGLKPKHVLTGLLVIALVVLLSWNFILQDYQQERVLGFFQPEYDPLGVNYSSIQSKIAIGSGGFFGKGFRQGTQTQLGFLPEASTDFIFASLIEEWGLLGGTVVLVAFLLMIFRLAMIGLEADSNFYRLVCLGGAIMFLLQFVINVGSALGMLPVIGVTFPFLSYGGSSMIANSILIGIAQSARRFASGSQLAKVHSSVL